MPELQNGPDLSGFPDLHQQLVAETIERYSLNKSKGRLLLLSSFSFVSSPVVIEIPVDDPKLTLLMAAVAPMNTISVCLRDSPKLKQHLRKYHDLGGKRKPQPTSIFGGAGVLEISALPGHVLDAKYIQIHPLFNAAAAAAEDPDAQGLSARVTSGGGVSATSEGCAGVATLPSFIQHKGFCEVDTFFNMQGPRRTVRFDTLGQKACLQGLYGQEAFVKAAIDRFEKSSNDLSLAEASVLMIEEYDRVSGSNYAEQLSSL